MLTKKRIDELERVFANHGDLSGDAFWRHVYDRIGSVPELCRFARIGLCFEDVCAEDAAEIASLLDKRVDITGLRLRAALEALVKMRRKDGGA